MEKKKVECRPTKHNFVSSSKFWIKNGEEIMVVFCTKCGCRREITTR